MGGEDDGARTEFAEAVKKMSANQFRCGKLKDGDVCYVKLASDGTLLTKQKTATVTTATVINQDSALQIGTIALVFAGETYEVCIS